MPINENDLKVHVELKLYHKSSTCLVKHQCFKCSEPNMGGLQSNTCCDHVHLFPL